MRKALRNFILCLPLYLLVLLIVSAVALGQVPFVNLPLVPDAKAPGGADFTVTVNGTGFKSSSVVKWNGSPRVTTFVSASQLKAAIPAADTATRGTASVTVVNPAPGGGTSNAAFFSVTATTGHSGAFVPGSSQVTAACPGSVATGDFNGDGNLDLAAADYCSNRVSVLLGDGAGNLVIGPSPATGNGPQYLAAGDFNGDGKLDLAVVNYLDGTASILIGDGTGNFTLASSPVIGSWPLAVAVGDFNRDGHLDLAVTLPDRLSIFLGDGAGNFTLASSPAYSGALAVGDFDRDGILDLAVTNNIDNRVSILLGDGTGKFNFYSSAATGDYPSSILVGDFNGDNKLDLAIANLNHGPTGDSISILLGDGTGKFTLASSPAPGINPGNVIAGDFNADGKLDLAVADVSFDAMYGGITIMVGDGKGNFSLTATSPASFDNVGNLNFMAVGDFNRDGKLDVAVADWGSKVAILLNHGRQSQTSTTLASAPNPGVFSQAVTFTAAVSSGSEKPTGVVVFWEGSAMLGTATLTGGSASLSLPLAAGSHSITAQYLGSLLYSASTSTLLTQVVNSATTTTSLVSSLNPAFINQMVTYTATVTSQYGGTVAGKVSLQDGGVTVATGDLQWDGRASFSMSYPAGATHQITGIYLGDSNNTGSRSDSLAETIWQPTIGSTTAVVTSGSPSFVGQPVTFTAKITPKSGTIPNGELVTFYDVNRVVASVPLAGGMAAYSTSSLSAGTHNVYAKYFGDANFQASSGYVKQVVLSYATTTALTSSPNPSASSQTVTFTATVTPSGPFPLTGWVRFWDGTTIIGTIRINGGVAVLTKSTLAVGMHAITARYQNDMYNATSISNEVDQVVR